MPFKCSYCGQYFCDDHRLPEQHLCPSLSKKKSWSRFKKNKGIKTPRIAPKLPSPSYHSTSYPRPKRNIKLGLTGWYYLIIFGVILVVSLYDRIEDSKLRNFQTRQELISFLSSDGTDRLTWAEDFTCDDFTRVLILHAKEKGYRLNRHEVTNPNILWPNEEFYWEGDGGHALCKAYIENEDLWVVIEPQNDSLLTYRSN